jgi:hypothetical protein
MAAVTSRSQADSCQILATPARFRYSPYRAGQSQRFRFFRVMQDPTCAKDFIPE